MDIQEVFILYLLSYIIFLGFEKTKGLLSIESKKKQKVYSMFDNKGYIKNIF